MNWKKVKLGEIINVKTGKLDANAQIIGGKYPFFTCSQESLQIDTYSYDCECVLIAGNGDLNVKYFNGKFDAYQRTYIVESRDKIILDVRFLYHFMSKYVEKLRLDSIGGVIKYIKIGNITDVLIPLPDLATQQHIAQVLDQADALRQQNRQLLGYYDELLQSTFIELFGKNAKDYDSWTLEKIENIVENKKGSMRSGPFGSDLLHSEFVDSGVFVLGIDNVVHNRFEWARMRYITEEKYQKLKRYTVFPGDLLISIMATVGRVAIVPQDMPLAINSKHLAAITLDKSKVNPMFIAYNLHSNPEVTRQIAARGRGAIMEGLNLGLIKEMKIKIPSLPLQQHFAKIVEEIEAQKSLVQQSLAESEALFEGLLAEYFG
ncbi:type I restriction enzyme, S subunit [Pseudarcicella hirudinis]|uniref:Type I restriction enzyme, S subunit n=1 Tax=Pseudarcicella hirudinis TaxID=1079859 RepID=A0A1I5U697_9BACT|nr:restriction endonuclease subunit S [Pseudarcicella hirudinis]SFP90818.1 type I restriction enzyme, S subunit [Pseudarcicella hirudinis]